MKVSDLNYFTSLYESREHDKLYEAKMVLVGKGGGGFIAEIRDDKEWNNWIIL